MIRGGVSGPMGGTPSPLYALRNADWSPLAQQVREIILRGTRRMIESGRDVNGKPLAPLASSTRRRSGDHEPLRPGGRDSFADSLRVEIRVDSRGFHLDATFDHPAAALTKTGTKNQPARDVFGIDAATSQEIDQAVARFIDGLLR